MPSDRSHNEQIKLERQLMQETGLTRMQIRKSLQNFDRFARQLQEAARIGQNLPKSQIEVRETKLEPITTDLELSGTQKTDTFPTVPPAVIEGNEIQVIATVYDGGDVLAKKLTIRAVDGGTYEG